MLETVNESYLRSFILNIKGKTKLQLANKEVMVNKAELSKDFKLAVLQTPSLAPRIIPNLTKQ